MKREAEEMKGKIYTLRTQKMETDRRLIEMQSTVDSLKDEHKTMETALQEKRNETESPQLAALKQNLLEKELEIQNLKRRLEYQAEVLCVKKKDDSLDPALNVTDKTDASELEGGLLNMSNNSTVGQNLTLDFDGSVVDENVSQEQNGTSFSALREQKVMAEVNSTESTHVQVEQRDQNIEMKTEKLEEDEVNSRGGVKLEVLKTRSPLRSRHRKRGHGRLIRTKGKRWRTHAKVSDSETNGVNVTEDSDHPENRDVDTSQQVEQSHEVLMSNDSANTSMKVNTENVNVRISSISNANKQQLVQEDEEVGDRYEPETDDEPLKAATSDLEEDKQEYKTDIDESEF